MVVATMVRVKSVQERFFPFPCFRRHQFEYGSRARSTADGGAVKELIAAKNQIRGWHGAAGSVEG
jgi:hypothetical protein